jgi:hypothetical protein
VLAPLAFGEERDQTMTPDQYAKLTGVSAYERPTLSGPRLGDLPVNDLGGEVDLWKRVEKIINRLESGCAPPTAEERRLLDDFARWERRMWSWALGLPD